MPSGVRDVTLMTHICSHLAECLFAIFCNQTWCCGAPPWAGMSCKKVGFYLQGQGHSVGLYNQNMTISTISFISRESFATKLNLSVDHHKQRSVQWKCWIVVFKVSVTAKVKSFSYDSLDILCIAEPFVNKPRDIIITQSVIYEKWVSIFKVKVTVTEIRFIQSNMTISMFWTADFFMDNQLSLTVHVHKLECLVKRLLCCIQSHSEGSELQWMFARTISLIGQI